MFSEQAFQTYVNTALAEPTLLNEAMKYSLLGGGKRIRPTLAQEAAKLASLSNGPSESCAFAIEIAHAFSLVHDDLPCMDNDDFRRGLPTSHRKFGEAQALLAGDALLNFANETFLECLAGVSPEAFFRSFRFFVGAIGSEGMILGQSEELHFDDSNLENLIRIQKLKTGKLFQASLLCPILLSGKLPSDPLYVSCEKYADAFGFAFQIADDLEDAAQDQIQNAKNILSHLGRSSAVKLAREKLFSCEISDQFSVTSVLLSKLK